MRIRAGNIMLAHDGQKPGNMRVLLTANDDYEAATIRIPSAYLIRSAGTLKMQPLQLAPPICRSSPLRTL